MDNFSTPKFSAIRRQKFVTPSLSTSYKSPLINKVAKKIDFVSENTSELKSSTVELWQKNDCLKKEIQDLKNQGYEEDQLKWYIDKLHEYNEIKDLAQMVMGRIAVFEKTTVRKVHEEFGMTDSD